MKLKMKALLIIAILFVVGLVVLFASRPSPTSKSTSTLFSDQWYAPYAYLIYPGTLSPQAQAALSGFSLSETQLQNGSTMVTLTYISTGSNQTVIVKPGYQLYFIETSFNDDGSGGEFSLGDDSYVTVDPSGHVA